MITHILNILPEYLTSKDIATLNMTNKNVNNILKDYYKLPNNVGYCKFCNISTCWTIYKFNQHCCLQCFNKNNITSRHLVKIIN